MWCRRIERCNDLRCPCPRRSPIVADGATTVHCDTAKTKKKTATAPQCQSYSNNSSVWTASSIPKVFSSLSIGLRSSVTELLKNDGRRTDDGRTTNDGRRTDDERTHSVKWKASGVIFMRLLYIILESPNFVLRLCLRCWLNDIIACYCTVYWCLILFVYIVVVLM